MGENENRHGHCCFTGHRPKKLKISETEVRKALRAAIEKAISEGYTTFFSGMACGVDSWAAECVLSLREVYPAVKLVCVLPYPEAGQPSSPAGRERYRRVLQSADRVETLCPGYFAGGYQKRNIWMVEHSALVLAVYNGEPGGTRNTIQYAQSHGVMVRMLLEEVPSAAGSC